MIVITILQRLVQLDHEHIPMTKIEMSFHRLCKVLYLLVQYCIVSKIIKRKEDVWDVRHVDENLPINPIVFYKYQVSTQNIHEIYDQ